MTCQDCPFRDVNAARLSAASRSGAAAYLREHDRPWRCHLALKVGIETPCTGAAARLKEVSK